MHDSDSVRRKMLRDVEEIWKTPSFWHQANFDARGKALEALEFNVLDEAKALVQELEDLNQSLFQSLREKIRAGVNIRDLIRTCDLDTVRSAKDLEDVGGYDSLDEFLNGIFSIGSIPVETKDPEPEMVYYQKTPGRIVLEMVERASLTEEDVFYDLGSGLGQVPILVNLLSEAPAKGVEYEPSYCSYAESCAQDLGLSGVTFVNADVRDADLSDGTVFFLYTPFTGNMLEDVLEKLRQIAEQKSIRIFTYGPCTLEVSAVPWLRSENQESPRVFTLREFRNL